MKNPSKNLKPFYACKTCWQPLTPGLLALAAFVLLAAAVFNCQWLTKFDANISEAVVANRNNVLTFFAQSFSFIAGKFFVLPLALVIIAMLWFKRHRFESIIFAFTMGLTSALVVSLKLLFQRPRPNADFMLGPINKAFAFPSGHTMHATVFYGLIIYALVFCGEKFFRREFVLQKTTGLGLWFLLCAFVGAARVYLGYHWLTDVVAGFCLGVFILAMALFVYQQKLGQNIFSVKC